jgi:hypothetical protein
MGIPLTIDSCPGGDFTVKLCVGTVNGVLPVALGLRATFRGPVDNEEMPVFEFKTRVDTQTPRADDETYILHGTVPKNAPLGEYHMVGLALAMSGSPARDYPEEDVLGLNIWLSVKQLASDAPPPLPPIRRSE